MRVSLPPILNPSAPKQIIKYTQHTRIYHNGEYLILGLGGGGVGEGGGVSGWGGGGCVGGEGGGLICLERQLYTPRILLLPALEVAFRV